MKRLSVGRLVAEMFKHLQFCDRGPLGLDCGWLTGGLGVAEAVAEGPLETAGRMLSLDLIEKMTS